ncbi:MAG: polyprenyl synthetase family protein [Pseudobdellovibrionaceae bacterium]
MSEALLFEQHRVFFNQFAEGYFKKISAYESDLFEPLNSSVKYSLLQNGKRFRPLLAMLVGEVFSTKKEVIAPFALAIECIHTYSLIHDDLPCMDNDDFRRGQPTNHKKYSESTALLAGDCLLTESFRILADNYSNSDLLSHLIKLVSVRAGIYGMVGGQVLDLNAKDKIKSVADLQLLHQLKTGALIAAAAAGAAKIANVSEEDQKNITEFAETLGLAFQVADDILDQDQKNEINKSFIYFLGLDKTKTYLQELTENAKQSAKRLSVNSEILCKLVDYNLNRNL